MPTPNDPSAATNGASPQLGHEWATLQNNYEACERSALLVKLGAVALFTVGVACAFSTAVAMVLTLVLWLQEAILRTGQARLGARLLRVEASLRSDAPAGFSPFQLHTEWLAGRAGLAGLVAEYAANAVKPTVAFPYAALLLVQWWLDAA